MSVYAQVDRTASADASPVFVGRASERAGLSRLPRPSSNIGSRLFRTQAAAYLVTACFFASACWLQYSTTCAQQPSCHQPSGTQSHMRPAGLPSVLVRSRRGLGGLQCLIALLHQYPRVYRALTTVLLPMQPATSVSRRWRGTPTRPPRKRCSTRLTLAARLVCGLAESSSRCAPYKCQWHASVLQYDNKRHASVSS